MEKRTLLAVVLSFIVIMVWQTWVLPPPPVPEESASPGVTPTGVSTAESAAAGSSGPEATAGSAGTADPSLAGMTEATPEVLETNLPEQETTLARDAFVAVFTTEGGGIKSWKLNDYTRYRRGEGPLDVVRNLLASKPILERNETKMDLLGGPYANAVPFRVRGDGSTERRCELVEHGDAGVTYRCRDGQVRLLKRYTVEDDPYLVHLEVEATNVGPDPVTLRPWLGVRGWAPAEKRGTFAPTSVPAYHANGETERVDPEDVEGEETVVQGEVDWAGVDDKYFLRAILPPVGEMSRVAVRPLPASASRPGDIGEEGPVRPFSVAVESSNGRVVQPGETMTVAYDLFLGPKRSEVLGAYERNLEESLDFGMFGVFAEPILALLKLLYRWVGSYGVAIILLTVIIKTLFYPLMVKQMESAAKMKEFQPQMAELRERYKDDKEKLNQEMMRFMQEKKINPLGGCLPLLLQMPIWFALYRVLQNSIELYHTPFLYLPDLSERDPFGISPLVLGVLMFVQQKMTPPAPGMDPVQAKMMQYLPLIFAAIMFTLPSGLVVYILVNTILTIIQQAYITKRTAAKAGT